MGSILAHGSIVAREYGIPAVLGVGNGTRRIKHGQMITIDGDGASGHCSLELRATRGDESMIGAGRIHDEYRKVDDEWKFASRRIEMFYFVPLSEGWATSDGPGHL